MRKIFLLFLVSLLAFVLTVPAANAVGPPARGFVDNPKDDHPWGGDSQASVNAVSSDDTGWGTERGVPPTATVGPPSRKADGGWIDPAIADDGGWAGSARRVWTIFSMLFAGW
ncbi:MAG: hypothetical protein Q8O51_02945 [bacterium]|nr:hypothetical protein [bacterium]